MSRAKWLGIVVGMAVAGCEAAPEPVASVEPVAPVAPVEVMGPVEEIARLRARVSELERQLEGCAAPSGTEPAAVPEGVDPPEAPVVEATGPAPSKRPVQRDPSLLDSVLPRRRGDDTIELPDPARLLLGGE